MKSRIPFVTRTESATAPLLSSTNLYERLIAEQNKFLFGPGQLTYLAQRRQDSAEDEQDDTVCSGTQTGGCDKE